MINLGLSPNQAKIYVATANKGFCDVRSITRISQVPRQEIYKILSKLQEIGLMEKSITNPIKYRAIPITEGMSLLVEKKIQETKKLKNEAQEYIKHFHEKHNFKLDSEFESPQFVLIPEKNASIRKRKEEIDNAQLSIDFLSSWKRFPLTVDTFGRNTKKALDRNVKIRVILEKPPKGTEPPELVENFKEYSNYELKYVLDPPSAILAIFDKKRMMVKTSSSVGLADASSLWSNNPCLLSLINDCFELKWITAMETIPSKLNA